MELAGPSYLEHLDLAAGRVQVFRVLPILTLLEGIDLHPKGHALLAPVLPRGELCADAVHLQGTRGGQVARSRRGWALDRPPPMGSSPNGGFHSARSDPPPPLRSPPVLSTLSGRWPPHPLTTEGLPSHLCPLTLEALPDHLSPCRCSRPTDPNRPPHSCP